MRARGRAGLTQLALASPDLSKSFISLLESARSYPSVETATSLAQRVNTSLASLLMDPPGLRLETAFNLVHLAGQMDLAARGAEAVQLLATAEALLPDMPVDLRVRAVLVRARAAIAGNRLKEAARWANEAVTIARRHQLAHRLGMSLALKGEVEVSRHAYRAALPLLEQATSIMRRTRAARTEENVRALISLGTTRFQLGRIDLARKTYRRAQELAVRIRSDALRGKAFVGLGMAEWARRRLDPAVEYLTRAYDVFERVEDLTEMSRVLTNLGLIRREQGRYEDALSLLERTLRVKERLGDGGGRSAALEEMAQVLLAMGRVPEAGRAARRAIREAQAVGDRLREADAQVTLARVLRAQDRRGEAIELLKGAVATLTRLGLASQAAAASGELGLMLTDAGADKEAAGYLKQALTPRTTPLTSRPASAMEEPPGPQHSTAPRTAPATPRSASLKALDRS